LRRPPDDYDTAYKEVTDHYPAHFFNILWPEIHALIDWSRGVESLEQELRYAIRLAGRGKRTVDKLFRVWLKDGRDAWVLLHVEFQSQVDPTLPERVFICSTLLFARHRMPVASFVVLGDPTAEWRPEGFGYDAFGRGAHLSFHTVKLLDWQDRLAELEASSNPFALIILAHLASLETKRKPRNRLEWKKRLTLWLLEKGAPEQVVVDLFRFMDLIMALPDDLAVEYDEAAEEYRRRETMPVLSQTFQRAAQRAEREGALNEAREAVIRALDVRFPEAPDTLRERIRAIGDLPLLRELQTAVIRAASVEDIEAQAP